MTCSSSHRRLRMARAEIQGSQLPAQSGMHYGFRTAAVGREAKPCLEKSPAQMSLSRRHFLLFSIKYTMFLDTVPFLVLDIPFVLQAKGPFPAWWCLSLAWRASCLRYMELGRPDNEPREGQSRSLGSLPLSSAGCSVCSWQCR